MTPVRTPLLPRLLCLLYESLILAGVLMAAGLPFVMFTHYGDHPEFRPLYRAYLFAIVGLYFCYFWHRSGQTVPMKTWRLRLLGPGGAPPTWGQCCLRYFLAWPGMISGVSLLWALWDREGQYLHDRLLGLRIVQYPSTQA